MFETGQKCSQDGHTGNVWWSMDTGGMVCQCPERRMNRRDYSRKIERERQELRIAEVEEWGIDY